LDFESVMQIANVPLSIYLSSSRVELLRASTFRLLDILHF